MIPAGGHILDCVHALRDVIRDIFKDDPPYFTALRAPLLDEENPQQQVRVPVVMSGWPDFTDRSKPLLPFVAVRPPSVRQQRSDGEVQRTTPIAVVIGVQCQDPADYEYAWVVAERICMPLCRRPYLRDGVYTIDWENIDCAENADLMDSWQAYFLQMTVPVLLPAYIQTEGPKGEKITWEASYGDKPYEGYFPTH